MNVEVRVNLELKIGQFFYAVVERGVEEQVRGGIDYSPRSVLVFDDSVARFRQWGSPIVAQVAVRQQINELFPILVCHCHAKIKVVLVSHWGRLVPVF